MEITIDGRKAKVSLADGATVGALVLKLGLSREETLVKVNGKLAPDGMKIAPKDQVKVMRVIFGG